MDWKPKGYKLSTKCLVRAIFDSNSDDSKILDAAAYGNVELFADAKSWNAVLWLIMSTIKNENNQPIYSGDDLGEIRNCLPITFNN